MPIDEAPAPVLVFSHGQGRSHLGYAPLVEAWADAGFAVIQPAHAGRPDGLPRGVWHARIMDMHRVITGLDALAAAVPALAGRFDTARIAVAGHSYGGHTAASLAGARVRDPATGVFGDFGLPQVRAALLLAPPGNFDGLVPAWKARAPYLTIDWRFMHAPMLLAAGMKDDLGMSALGWRWRTDAFWNAGPARKYLVVLAAGHDLGGIDEPEAQTPPQVALIGQLGAAFLATAFDPAAGAWGELWAGLQDRPDLIYEIDSR